MVLLALEPIDHVDGCIINVGRNNFYFLFSEIMNGVESAVPLSHASYNNEASENDFEKGRIQIGFANAKDGQTSKKNEMHEESKKNGHPFKPHNVCSKPTIYR